MRKILLLLPILISCSTYINKEESFNRLYSDSSPFNRKIGANPKIAEDSDIMIQSLIDSKAYDEMFLTTKEWTTTLFYADETTPKYDVIITATWSDRAMLLNVPIPDNAIPDPEDDGHMVVLDMDSRVEYDFWQARKEGDIWYASYANSISIDSDGIFDDEGYSCRGSGFALLAGMIFPEELINGRIDHALIFTYKYTKKGVIAIPATESDGITDSPKAIPEGARLQLDPKLDLDTLGLLPWERTIARAMQEYGMFLGDTGGGVELEAVNALSYRENPYKELGIDEEWGYEFLDKIPLTSFRVLEFSTK